MGDWHEVLADQLALLSTSGLWAASKVKLCMGTDLARGENTTLLKLWEWCQDHPSEKVWYIHTKGVSRPGDENARLWRKYMEYFVIERWRDCEAALPNYDACGVDWAYPGASWVLEAWGGETGFSGFLGNIWWATSDCIARCKPDALRGDNRHAAEFEFIGTSSPLVKCFHASRTNLYQNAYPPERYRQEGPG